MLSHCAWHFSGNRDATAIEADASERIIVWVDLDDRSDDLMCSVR